MQILEEKEIAVTEGASRPVDILDRAATVENIMNLVNAVSESRGSCTFSLNGSWGAGKSFVLNMLEEQLLTYQAGTRYVVFHYNCWKYDYYEEPLHAIVAAMLERIDAESHFFSKEARANADAALKAAEPILKRIVSAVSKNRIGFDLVPLYEVLKYGPEVFETAKKENEIERSAEDPFFYFNRTLQNVRDQMKELSKDRTIVVVVDELDRCLPTYAIKVLERLHHLFYGMENCIVVMAVAKEQLHHTIKQVFGDQIDIERYLKKFVDYQMELDTGTIQKGFRLKYDEYISLFDSSLIEVQFDIDEFAAALFDGIDPRTQEQLMERIKTIHKIIFMNEHKDFSVMAFEMMLGVFSYYGFTEKNPISYEGGFHVVNQGITSTSLNKFAEYLGDKWNKISKNSAQAWGDEEYAYVFTIPVGVPQLMLWYLGQKYKDRRVAFKLYTGTPRMDEYEKNYEDLNRFDHLLKIIK